MLKLLVDSGSSIKQQEAEAYGVEILPLKIRLGEEEYLDGVDLSMDRFYHALIDEKIFPKTSLPSLGEAEEMVNRHLENGDEVLILSLSSGLSGTFNALRMHFENEPRVRVIDTKTAVGGVRILIREVNKMREMSLDEIEARLTALISKIRVVAIPETLEYLMRGGRLSRSAWAVGSILQLKPLISLDSSDGRVKVLGKERGLRNAMKKLSALLLEMNCDENYPIVPSYTYCKDNLDRLIEMTDKRFHAQMIEYDNLDPAIACHWGPNAFGYIFVSKN